jgi:hypothetical protein
VIRHIYGNLLARHYLYVELTLGSSWWGEIIVEWYILSDQ